MGDRRARPHTEALFKTKPVFTEHVKRTRSLMISIERDYFGTNFGLFLHFTLHMTMPNILRCNQAVMEYDRAEAALGTTTIAKSCSATRI